MLVHHILLENCFSSSVYNLSKISINSMVEIIIEYDTRAISVLSSNIINWFEISRKRIKHNVQSSFYLSYFNYITLMFICSNRTNQAIIMNNADCDSFCLQWTIVSLGKQPLILSLQEVLWLVLYTVWYKWRKPIGPIVRWLLVVRPFQLLYKTCGRSDQDGYLLSLMSYRENIICLLFQKGRKRERDKLMMGTAIIFKWHFNFSLKCYFQVFFSII